MSSGRRTSSKGRWAMTADWQNSQISLARHIMPASARRWTPWPEPVFTTLPSEICASFSTVQVRGTPPTAGITVEVPGGSPVPSAPRASGA